MSGSTGWQVFIVPYCSLPRDRLVSTCASLITAGLLAHPIGGCCKFVVITLLRLSPRYRVSQSSRSPGKAAKRTMAKLNLAPYRVYLWPLMPIWSWNENSARSSGPISPAGDTSNAHEVHTGSVVNLKKLNPRR